MTVEDWMKRAFVEKRKLMGFGHRVYKNGDHRAPILRSWGLKLAKNIGPNAQKWFDLGDQVQAIMLRDKAIHPNVEGIWGQANCGAKCHPRAAMRAAIRGQALAQTRARDEHTTLRLTAQASNWNCAGSRIAYSRGR